MWHSKVEFTIKGTVANNGEYLVDYGGKEAFAPFPMNQMVSTMSATINNNTSVCGNCMKCVAFPYWDSLSPFGGRLDQLPPIHTDRTIEDVSPIEFYRVSI